MSSIACYIPKTKIISGEGKTFHYSHVLHDLVYSRLEPDTYPKASGVHMITFSNYIHF